MLTQSKVSWETFETDDRTGDWIWIYFFILSGPSVVLVCEYSLLNPVGKLQMSDEVKDTPTQKSCEGGAHRSGNGISMAAAVQLKIYIYMTSHKWTHLAKWTQEQTFIFCTHFVLQSGWQRFAGANISLKASRQTQGCILHILFSVEFQDTYVTTIIGEKHFS